MAYSHFLSNKHNENAVYELFYRVNPFNGEVNKATKIFYFSQNIKTKKYSIFAGVEEVLSFLKYFTISEEDIAYLR